MTPQAMTPQAMTPQAMTPKTMTPQAKPMLRLALGLLAMIVSPWLIAPAVQAQPAITTQVTPGGIPFRYAHMPRSRTQAIDFGWRDGFAMSLGKGQAVGSWAMAMMQQGPRGMTRGEFSEDVKDAQARLALSSGVSGTFGALIAPPDKFESAIDLMTKILYEPALDPARFDEMQKNRLIDIRQARIKADTLAGDIATALFLPPGPLRQWRTGDAEMVLSVTIPGIETWRKAVLAREGMMVAAAGPAGIDDAARQIDRLLGRLPAKGADRRKPEFPIRDAAKTIVMTADVPQTYLVVGGWSGFRQTPDLAAAQLATTILRARLFKAVRETLGAAYGASASLSSWGAEPRFLSLRAAVEHDKAPAALEAIRTEYARFLANGITAEELEPEKLKLISETREAMRRAPYVAQQLRNAMMDGFPDDHVQTFETRLAAITAETVNSAIRTRLSGRPVSTIIIAPSADPFRDACPVKTPEQAEACR